MDELKKWDRRPETIIHVLRNPYGFDEESVRAVRNAAANRLELLENTLRNVVCGWSPMPDDKPGTPMPPKED